jgi:23S rRNA (cytosine1962-C5)-methyltransferase
MSHSYPIITLKAGKEKTVLQKHPWVFSGAIAKEPSNLQEGDIVGLHSSTGHYLATGHFHKGTILVRCFDYSNRAIDVSVWEEKISSAVNYRKALQLIDSTETNAFRLIHAEGDGFPGLVIDIYGNTAIIQCYTKGMYNSRQDIAEAIKRCLSGKITAIYDKSAETMAKQGAIAGTDGFLWKDEKHVNDEFVLENGIKFSIDFINGQKTGFFIDQRENRSLVKQYSKGKSVLNTFCYTGGFSLYAIEGGANKVHSVDSSKKAIEGVERNIALNFPNSNHESFSEDVMTFFKKTEEKYDLIILDPPAYAKHLSQVKNAMVGYRNLNTEGLKRIKPGGILFTFSCSQAVDKELFRKVVFQAAVQAGRNVRIMHQVTQPADHPVSIYHPEAEYLKGLVLFVE